MLLFGQGNRVVMAIGLGLVSFSFIASVIEAVKTFIQMTSKNYKWIEKMASGEMISEDMDEVIEKYTEEIFEMPEALPGRRCVERLRETISDTSTIEECVGAFEKECGIPIDEETLLFECGTFAWNQGKFVFSLTRQFPDGGDEFFHVTMDVLFEPDEDNKKLFDSIMDEEDKEDFFDSVRRSKSYHYAQENRACKVRIYMIQT